MTRAGVFGASAMVLDPAFLCSSALAQTSKPMVFLSAENITGNWDPTAHTTLSQKNVEGFVMGFLTRTPMRLDDPEKTNYELATSIKLLDEHRLEIKLRNDIKFSRRQAVQGRRREGDDRIRRAAGSPGAVVSRPDLRPGDNDARRLYRHHRHDEGRLSRRSLHLPRFVPADHVGDRRQGRPLRPADAAPERHRPLQI